ncbi:MAG: zinc ribbon domain-containing protein [Shewanella sp.]
MPLSVRNWECPECEAHHDRDVNAAINIKAAGLAVLAHGATVNPKAA